MRSRGGPARWYTSWIPNPSDLPTQRRGPLAFLRRTRADDIASPPPELGVNLVAFTPDDFSRAEGTGAIDRLRHGIRADRAVLVPTFYTDDAAGERMMAHPQKTSTLAALENAVRAAGARGLRVALKPHIDRVDEGFRGEIAPTGAARERFFTDYRARVLEPLAAVAARHPGVVDRVVVATELCALAGADREWRACVQVLRRGAPGVRVGVACNYDALVPGDRRPAPTTWLDALDFVGVDWFPGESDRDRPPGRLARDLAAVRRRSGLPVCFTELGSRADLPGGDDAQRDRVAATIEDFRGRVDGFWLYNRFADDPGCDVERYTLAQPLMLHLRKRFPR